MSDSDDDASRSDAYDKALDARRLSARIAAVTNRIPKPRPVLRDDGTVLLRGRRRSDRAVAPVDRRTVDRRKS